MLSLIPFWIGVFWLTEPKPVLRSFFSSILLTTLGFLGFFWPEWALLGGRFGIGYYIVDSIVLAQMPSKNGLFLFHHLVTLAISIDSYWEADLPWGNSNLRQMALIQGLMNFSTIFFNWKEMARDPSRYSGWYPGWSFEVCSKIFGIAFLLSRGLFGIPAVWFGILGAGPVTQLGLILTIGFTSYWSTLILRKALKDWPDFRNGIFGQNPPKLPVGLRKSKRL